VLLFIYTSTIIISKVDALCDLKKIIALLTLRQVGLMMIILSMGLFHLMTRTVFKSPLFLSVGIVIHLIKNNQNTHYRESLREIIPFAGVIFYQW